MYFKNAPRIAEAFEGKTRFVPIRPSFIIGSFLGELFCKNKDLGLNPDQVKACQGYASTFVNSAIRVIGITLNSQSSKACGAWFDGICQA